MSIKDSFVRLQPPDNGDCLSDDWHGDGIQGYGQSGDLTVTNITIDMSDHTDSTGHTCYGTAPFFVEANQSNQGNVTVDRLMVEGMGFPFRLSFNPGAGHGSVTALKVVDHSWVFGPTSVNCSQIVAVGSEDRDP